MLCLVGLHLMYLVWYQEGHPVSKGEKQLHDIQQTQNAHPLFIPNKLPNNLNWTHPVSQVFKQPSQPSSRLEHKQTASHQQHSSAKLVPVLCTVATTSITNKNLTKWLSRKHFIQCWDGVNGSHTSVTVSILLTYISVPYLCMYTFLLQLSDELWFSHYETFLLLFIPSPPLS